MIDEKYEIIQKILKILKETEQRILDEGFNDYDSSEFLVKYDLRVIVNGVVVGVSDGW